MQQERPIGIFDSGIGGLSVLQAIRRALPLERLVYIADSANSPYGEKPSSFIRERCLCLAEHLAERGAKCLVVACNTATAAGIDNLRSELPLPVIGMEPGIKPALSLSESGVVGVLATSMTLQSSRYSRLAGKVGQGGIILTQPCHGLVELIETGRFDDPAILDLLRRYIEPLLSRGADTLVLGCTHYPLVLSQIREVAGEDVSIVDTGRAVARHVRRRLQEEGRLAGDVSTGETELLTTGEIAALEICAGRLMISGSCRMRQLRL